PDLVDHCMSRPERRPEVETRELAHPVDELRPHRLVQPEEDTLAVDDVLRDARTGGAQGDDVSWDEPHDDEGEDRDPDERRGHEQEPPDDVPPHGRYSRGFRRARLLGVCASRTPQ